MKILLFAHFPYPHLGGISSHMTILGKGLTQNGHEVRYLSFSYIPSIFGDLLVRVPSFLLNKIARGLGFYWRITSIIFLFNFILLFTQLKNKYAIINCQDVVAFNSTYLVRKLLNTKVVLTVHGYLKNEVVAEGQVKLKSVEDFLENCEKRAYSSSKLVISVDERIKNYILNELKVKTNVVLVPNFVDVTDFKPIKKIRSSVVKIICPRRLVKKNGVLFGAMAMKYLPKNFVLTIIGEGNERREIENCVLKNSLSNKVKFVGPKQYSDMISYYQSAQYTFVPSITIANVEEATSISALESMATGTPVIASNIGGLKLLIKNKINGILVDQKDPLALANAIIMLEKNKKLYNKISKESVFDVLKNYSHLSAAKKFENLYKSV